MLTHHVGLLNGILVETELVNPNYNNKMQKQGACSLILFDSTMG